jgi:hypothetical protein
MGTFDAISTLPLEIEGYDLEGQELGTPDFERLTTVIRLRGEGEEGQGEDVTYDAVDHVALQDAGPTLDLTGHASLGEYCEFMDGVDTFPSEPQRDVSRRYRRWAFESAALDLALRQNRLGLAAALEREAQPVNFVCSMRLASLEGGEGSSIEPLRRKLDRYPTLRFKLDPANDWTDELIAELVESGAVDSLDLKGFYKGTPVDIETDPDLYRRLIGAFPTAWLEDPDVNDETRPILEEARDRLTWDAPIHSIADILALPWPPRMVNIKPSRMGGLRSLFDAYDHCAENGIGAYGGGQWELGVGRGQIQALASIFHPDTPNDTAPRGYNEAEPPEGLPTSPLEPRLSEVGFRWDG